MKAQPGMDGTAHFKPSPRQVSLPSKPGTVALPDVHLPRMRMVAGSILTSGNILS